VDYAAEVFQEVSVEDLLLFLARDWAAVGIHCNRPEEAAFIVFIYLSF